MELAILGIDISKTVFHLHGVDEKGKQVLKKKLKRAELKAFVANLSKCLIAMEACGGSNYWGREFRKLGHEVKLISPQFVKPYVKTNKNDFNDAAAIAEAASRPHMRFVPIKTLGQQELQFLHRSRQRLIEARTGLMNQIRGFLHEYGIVIPTKATNLKKYLPWILGDEENDISRGMREIFFRMQGELTKLEDEIAHYDAELMMVAATDEDCKRIQQVPGVGHISATALLAAMPHPKLFKNGRQFSAWLGLVPRQNSTGGRNTLLGISKRGDSYLRYLLIHGARSVLLHAAKKRDPRSKWIIQKKKEIGHNRACVAIANKNARTIWAMLARNENFKKAA
jgi:transposase